MCTLILRHSETLYFYDENVMAIMVDNAGNKYIGTAVDSDDDGFVNKCLIAKVSDDLAEAIKTSREPIFTAYDPEKVKEYWTTVNLRDYPPGVAHGATPIKNPPSSWFPTQGCVLNPKAAALETS